MIRPLRGTYRCFDATSQGPRQGWVKLLDYRLDYRMHSMNVTGGKFMNADQYCLS